MGIALAAGVIGIALLGIAFGYSPKPEVQSGFTMLQVFASSLGCMITGAFSGLLLTHVRRAN